ncbi:MAG: glycosyltransferase family 39 protein [Acidobacteriota bacterium]|nr:MAG: glycosyltransferase family 39 protein [Acidobacteriota bacterium]
MSTADNSRQRFQIILFILFVAYLSLFYRLGALPFSGSDEPRYARIAEEMVLSGDYVTPHLEGRPWLEKTPLLFWLESASYHVLGFSESSARLPVALIALLGALGLAYAAYSLSGSRVGILSLLMLLTSAMYAIFGRAASTDMPLAATFTWAALALYLTKREPRWLWPLTCGVALGLAVLAKGPVAVVLLVGIGLIYLIVSGDRPWSLGQIALIAVTGAFVSLPWFLFAWWQNGENFLIAFIVNHHMARFATDIHHHSQPFWYYLPILLAGFFPWVFFLGSSVRRIWRERQRPMDDDRLLEIYLWTWALIPFLFFTLSSSKLPGYILPVIPPLAYLAALEWERYFKNDLSVYIPMKVQLACLAAFSLVLGIILIFGFHFKYNALWTGIGIASPLALAAILGQLEFRRRRPATLLTILVGGAALTLAVIYLAATPIMSKYHSARDLSVAALGKISDQEPLVLYRYFHHSARYYAEFQTTRNAVGNIDQLRDYMLRHPQSTYIILTQESGRKELTETAGAKLLQGEGNLFLLELSQISLSDKIDDWKHDGA